MIKTTIAGENITAALETQQRHFRQELGLADALYDEWKHALAHELQTLRAENAMLRRRRLQMAKAAYRSAAR